mmetsp:Transcript_105625/g.186721  ORF Transcript_105625/g.186721 Transcript_105625/m.186721 type:complete len:671 (-) Transcript_105625:114-2126(-)
MMRTASLVVLLMVALPACVLATDARGRVTPLQKVIEMLGGMLSKAKAEMADEQVEFSKFSTWCAESNEASTKSIAQSAAAIEQLSADIAKADSDAAVLAEEIEATEATIAKTKAEVAALTAERKKANEIYLATHADFSESIDALTRAIQVMKAREADIPQKGALLQVQNLPRLPQHVKAALASFLALKSSGQEGAPEANAYEFQSTSVVDMLYKLKTQFIDQLNMLEKEEMSSKANYEMLMQQMTDDIGTDTKTVDKKTGEKAGKLEDSAEATADKTETEKAKAAEESALSDRTAECAAKTEEVEANQKVRADEITAIEKAIEILSSDPIKGNAETYLPSLVQVNKKGTMLAQLRSNTREAPSSQAARERVSVFLQGAAKKYGSRYLEVAAAHAAADPFGKVKKMIKDLIVKLMEEANAEADEHAYCQTELATNKMTREDKTAEVDSLTAKIEAETSMIEELTSDIALLSASVAELKSKQSEATEIRGEEKATNAKTVADAKEAQVAVQSAIKVLQEFYGAAAAAAMLQEGETKPYTGMKAASGGVMGMLEVIMSDFMRLETSTSTEEDEAQTAYEKMMDETNEDVAVKETEITHKSDKKDSSEETLRSLEKDRSLTQKELDKALKYYAELKASCLDTKLSYAERKVSREEEIASLKEALQMLAAEDLGF